MELTIDQALQQAVQAHKEGKLHEAELLYRAILQAKPQNPDANHNLGVLAVSFNRIGDALPFFKNALEANPSEGQFWLSYIDALIKEKQFDNARSLLKQGMKAGLVGEKVDALKAQLTTTLLVKNSDFPPINKTKTSTQPSKKISIKKDKRKNSQLNQKNRNHPQGPPEEKVNLLLEYYQKSRYVLAENLAKEIIQKYPDHLLSWKVLGALFMQTGRLNDSLTMNLRAVEISPNNAEALNNLGNSLKELGRLGEAEINYKKAIFINPTIAEAHSNLGNTLKELGRLEEAEKSYNKAIAIKPELAEAHVNLGITLQELGKLEGSESSFKEAIKKKPELAEAHIYLGITLQELGRLEEAKTSYKKAIAINPELALAHYNLGLLLISESKYELAAKTLKLINFKDSQSHLLKCLFFLNERVEFYDLLDTLINQSELNSTIGSITNRAEVTYGFIKFNTFCKDPFKYVLKINLSDSYDFSHIFVKPVKTILNQDKSPERLQNLLNNGRQTSGNLFNIEHELTIEIEKIIRIEIEKYRAFFKDSEEGFIKKWPEKYSISGWLISMKSGGKLRPHMHENGWISGSVYINVPPKSNVDSGNLVVCIDDQNYLLDGKASNEQIIAVTTGSLCLFPASLLHYTIPFESEEERIVLAFDVVPKSP
jgi:tetratricopeptide (TPR) repeat protein